MGVADSTVQVAGEAEARPMCCMYQVVASSLSNIVLSHLHNVDMSAGVNRLFDMISFIRSPLLSAGYVGITKRLIRGIMKPRTLCDIDMNALERDSER